LQDLKEKSNVVLIIFKTLLINFYALIIYLSNYLNLNFEKLILLSGLLILEVITTLFKQLILLKNIKNEYIRGIILSKFIIILIPIILAITAKIVRINLKEFINIGLDLLTLSTAYAIIANIYTIRTKKEMPQIDVIKIIGDKIAAFIEVVLKGIQK